MTDPRLINLALKDLGKLLDAVGATECTLKIGGELVIICKTEKGWEVK